MAEIQIIDQVIKQRNLSLCLLSQITFTRNKQLRNETNKMCNGRCKALGFLYIHCIYRSWDHVVHSITIAQSLLKELLIR